MTIVVIVSVLFQSGHSAEHAMCIVLYCINASFAMMVQKCAFSETFESYHHIALHCNTGGLAGGLLRCNCI